MYAAGMNCATLIYKSAQAFGSPAFGGHIAENWGRSLRVSSQCFNKNHNQQSYHQSDIKRAAHVVFQLIVVVRLPRTHPCHRNSEEYDEHVNNLQFRHGTHYGK